MNNLLVFVKEPLPGQVKTRLAAAVGAETAAALYAEWVSQILIHLQPVRSAARVIGYAEGSPAAAFPDWTCLVDDWWPQPAGDLGARLAEGFRRSRQMGARCTVAIGSDCLEIDATLVDRAFALLESHPVVVGPASDGGYYLIGCSIDCPELFEQIRWSTSETLSDQLRRCQELGLAYALLPVRSDIDTWDDWERYRQRH